jgi:hypothetical protein
MSVSWMKRPLIFMGRRLVRLCAQAFEGVYNLWIATISKMFERAGKYLRTLFMTMFKFDYETRGDRRFQTFNISNIDFDLFIVLIVIGAILATSLLFIFN